MQLVVVKYARISNLELFLRECFLSSTNWRMIHAPTIPADRGGGPITFVHTFVAPNWNGSAPCLAICWAIFQHIAGQPITATQKFTPKLLGLMVRFWQSGKSIGCVRIID